MTIKYRELKRRYELDGARQTVEHLSEALRQGDLRAEDFSMLLNYRKKIGFDLQNLRFFTTSTCNMSELLGLVAQRRYARIGLT